MGDLAKTGISAGRIGPVRITKSALIGGQKIDPFSKDLLGHFGFVRIAQKIADGDSLKYEEIKDLAERGSLPILMKLVELKDREPRIAPPKPVIALPLIELLKDHTPDRALEICSKLVLAIKHPDLELIIDNLETALDDKCVFDLIATLMNLRPGLKFIGPRLEGILKWLEGNEGNGQESEYLDTLEKTLTRLKEIGCYRLAALHFRGVAKVISKVGLSSCIVTNVNLSSNAEDLAKELIRVDQLAGGDPLVQVWVPGAGGGYRTDHYKSPMLDIKLLRALALARLTFKHVRVLRASSRFFSLEALELAPYFGANDVGYGAVDDFTEVRLNFARYSTLVDALERFFLNEASK